MTLEMFADRLRDYKAGVTLCAASEVAAVVASLVSEVVVAPGLPTEWALAFAITDTGFTPAELTRPVLTGCAVAIASTGTIVLDGGPGQGRRVLTLVPDHHVCVVRTEQIVADVPDMFAALADPTRPLTLISGPSATSDIELNRVEGVHGPRRLDVIIVVQ